MGEPKKEATTKQIIAEVEAGTPVGQIAEKLGIDRTTVWRHLVELEPRFIEQNLENLSAVKTQQVQAHVAIIRGLLAGDIEAATGTSIRGHMDSIANILGLNATKRAVVAHISASTDQSKGMFVEFNRLVARKFQSWDKIVAFIRSCPDDPEDEPPYLLAGVVDEPTE
jgi:hypothetical protein